MRAEQLISVAKMVLSHLERRKLIEALEALITALDAQATSPTSEAQTATAAARRVFFATTVDADLDSLPARDAEIIASMKLPAAYGRALGAKVRTALNTNGVTPKIASNALKGALKSAKEVRENVQAAVDGLEYLEVRSDDLMADEFEIMVAIPGRAIKDELELFGKEALQLNRMLLVFEEIATGSREPLKLRAIASTDPTLYVMATAGAATVILTALEKLTDIYAKLLGVIKLQRELSGMVPAATIDPLKQHVAAELEAGLQQVKEEILAEHQDTVRGARQGEIDTELSFALRAIAKRLDEGYLFDVRAGTPTEPVDGEVEPQSSALDDQRAAARQIITEKRTSLRHFEAAAEPILGLDGPEELPPGSTVVP